MLKNITKLTKSYRQTFNRQRIIRPIFISSYIPQKCGLATFTRDLTEELTKIKYTEPSEIIGIDNGRINLYPKEVVFRIRRNIRKDYLHAAKFINNHTYNVVCLQFEFGLFGGWDGDFIFDLLENISLPIISTLHTVPSDPTESQMANLKRLAKISEYLIVMIESAKDSLRKIYDVPESKILKIHHGVTILKKEKGQNKRVRNLLISGLINKDKGIEYALRAMPLILKEFPQTRLWVVGQTHPAILKIEGERYRNFLKNIVLLLGIDKEVVFVNKYLPLTKLLDYYRRSDIYLTPHLKPEQASSGTLAYALGLGKVCISTPYLYASEMLTGNKGILVDFKNSKEIAEAVLSVLRDPSLEKKISRKASELGESMSWKNVSNKYFEVFKYAAEKSYTETPYVPNR